jgi:hypothetical protein
VLWSKREEVRVELAASSGVDPMRASVTAVLSAVPLILMVSLVSAHPLDDKCTQLSHKHREEQRSVPLPKGFAIDDTLMQFDAFYSPTFDACIHPEIADIGVYNYIRDLTYTLLRDQNVLLPCDCDGANSAPAAHTVLSLSQVWESRTSYVNGPRNPHHRGHTP